MPQLPSYSIIYLLHQPSRIKALPGFQLFLTAFTRRAIAEIDPSNYGETMDCEVFRDMVETRIPRLQSRLAVKGLDYDTTLLFATIDVDSKPVIGHITSSGLTEMGKQGYFTTGIAAPYAELVLQDSYDPKISVADARLIVGGLIDRISKVDNDVEGMNVLSISSKDREVKRLTDAERQGIELEPLSFNFKEELDDLREAVRDWQLFFDEIEKRPTKSKKSGGKKTKKQK